MKSIILLLCGIGLIALSGSFSGAAPSAVGEVAARDSSAVLPGASVYHVKSHWMDQKGDHLSWAFLQGRPRLVALFYTHCGYACPRIVHDLKAILSEVPEDDRRAVGVVLVSIDPEHDTLEALQGFSALHGLDWPQWTLLRGTDSDARELAAVLGFRYKQQPGGEFAHSNAIVLLDENGEVAARRNDNHAGVQPILDALTSMRVAAR